MLNVNGPRSKTSDYSLSFLHIALSSARKKVPLFAHSSLRRMPAAGVVGSSHRDIGGCGRRHGTARQRAPKGFNFSRWRSGQSLSNDKSFSRSAEGFLASAKSNYSGSNELFPCGQGVVHELRLERKPVRTSAKDISNCWSIRGRCFLPPPFLSDTIGNLENPYTCLKQHG